MRDEAIHKLQALPEVISRAQLRVLDAMKSKANAEHEISDRESKVFARVLAERNPETGKPTYTNDAARKTALSALLRTDMEYNDLDRKLKDAMHELRVSEIEVERLQRSHQSWRAIARILGVDNG